MIQFNNYDAPELREHPEAIDIVNKFRLMQQIGGGLSWQSIDDIEYPDYLALIVCVSAENIAREIREAEARAKAAVSSSRGSSASVMISREALLRQSLGENATL